MYICVCVCVHLVAHLPCILHTAAPLLVLRLLHWHATERVCVRCCATKARTLAPSHPHPPNANVNSLALLPRIFTFSCKILNRNKFSWNKFLPIRHFKTCGCCFCCHGSTIITNTKWDLDFIYMQEKLKVLQHSVVADSMLFLSVQLLLLCLL